MGKHPHRRIRRHHRIVVEKPEVLELDIAQQVPKPEIVAASKSAVGFGYYEGEWCHGAVICSGINSFGKLHRFGDWRL